jgi:hypothetical protein
MGCRLLPLSEIYIIRSDSLRRCKAFRRLSGEGAVYAKTDPTLIFQTYQLPVFWDDIPSALEFFRIEIVCLLADAKKQVKKGFGYRSSCGRLPWVIASRGRSDVPA